MPLREKCKRILVNKPRELARVDGRLRKVLQELCEGKRRWPLFLFGTPGGGKTSAALAVADILKTCCYFRVDDLADLIMQRSDETDQAWRYIKEKDLAILDEIGARSTTNDLIYGAVLKFSSLREDHAHAAAIYISNVAPSELSKLYDDRVSSRLLSGTVFELASDDRRAQR